jgi:Cu/Ag efflux protein CusF
MKMKRQFVVVVVISVALAMAACAHSPSSDAGRPGVVAVESIQWTATVKAVDYQKRTVTLEGTDGKTGTFNAKNVRNLDQVKVGDRVKVEYIEELAIFVRKSNESPSAMEGAAVGLAPRGQMPGGIVAETVQITANVEAIDYQNRTITLKGPQGNIKTFKVDQSIQRFDQIKQGDQVVVSYTEALLIAVVRP